jgi:hypothetical protein
VNISKVVHSETYAMSERRHHLSNRAGDAFQPIYVVYRACSNLYSSPNSSNDLLPPPIIVVSGTPSPQHALGVFNSPKQFHLACSFQSMGRMKSVIAVFQPFQKSFSIRTTEDDLEVG